LTPENCEHCGEPVLPAERADNSQPFHHECMFRVLMGSVAHVLRRCSCFVPGSEESDPPFMSKRNAARAAIQTQRLVDALLDHNAANREEPTCPKSH
jgi:hypothetical protein